MDHTADGHEPVIREEEAIQHPLGVYFILLPPILLLTLVAIGSLEADWTFFQRGVYFLKELIIAAPAAPPHH